MTRKARIFALLIAAVVAVSACGDDHGHDKKGAGKKAEEAHAHKEGDKHDEHGAGAGGLKLSDNEINAAGIQVAEVTEAEVNDAVNVAAVVRPHPSRVARVAPRVPGRVVTMRAALGDRVGRGQTLAVLDSLELGEARGAYQQARAELSIAQANYDRIEKLVAEEIIASKEKLRAQADLEKARAAERASRGRVQMLGGSAAQGDAFGVSTFAVIAPFAGVVIEQNDAAVGAMAQPDKPLFTVADLSVVSVEGSLHEQDLGRVTPGAIAEVKVTAFPDATFKGKVDHISAVMDKETRTIPVRIQVSNPDGRLRPEMFATAAIPTSRKARVITLPNDAVVLMQGVTTVFVEGQHGFEPRVVQTGDRTASGVTIKSGLKPGDMAVVAGAYALKARSMKSQIGSGHAH
jgi:cobalt-zinc-cadmium efflux system membrane fusion protein